MEQSDEDEEEEEAASNCQINKLSIELIIYSRRLKKKNQKYWYSDETLNTETAVPLLLFKNYVFLKSRTF